MKMKKTALAAALAAIFLPLGTQAASYEDVADTTESPIRIASSLEDPDITITGSTPYKVAVSASWNTASRSRRSTLFPEGRF